MRNLKTAEFKNHREIQAICEEKKLSQVWAWIVYVRVSVFEK